MSDNDLGKAVSETINLYNLENDDNQGEQKIAGSIDSSHVDERLVVFHRPRSIESEYFRFLKSRIEQEFEGTAGTQKSKQKGKQKGQVIMITGPNLAAGKTTCSINLALAFARTHGEKTLFIDMDSRKATSREYLGITEENLPGFTDVLTKNANVEQVLINSGMFDMVYFPSGKFSEAFLDNLNGKELLTLMATLRGRFKYIIIDAPPAFPMPEPTIVAQHCDGVFIVLKAGRDGQGDLTQAMEVLEGANVMGVILNAIKRIPGQRYGAYGYYGKR